MSRETKTITLRIEKSFADVLEKFPSVSNGVESIITKLQTMQKRSENELRGKFTTNEWKFFAASLNGTIADESIRYQPDLLVFHSEDAEALEGHATNFDVSIEDLKPKIMSLTAAQMDALYGRVERFWDAVSAGTAPELDAWAKF